ncbi:class I SAM-dependent methyltransferase [Nocardioides islandensis]|uniref:Class I SAM-dependent methyltransferase n=1 Tax=Nocardioides islandensis TaxID=433663 RepID=A0A930VHE0_9ACTN|nr:methyltransferase domain-containing protein [Nocardioides islandensis]MBF4763960.1 class I SAM-dependent methyltransferase [Nocardioides islandensis]
MTIIDQDEDIQLKAKHAAMWASGHYDAVATQLIAELGPVLVEAIGIRTGDLVLDVGAGSGNVAIPAALAGARVIASDLTPELLEQGEAHARERGAVLEWQVADAERLPYDDGQFDVAVSAVGIMFAPHHQAAADELLRVVTPGGRIGLVSWTPAGFIGQMFATMKPFVAPPPAGVQPPPLWGDEDHVRGLLGDRVTDVRTETRTVKVTLFAEPADFREFFKTNYGPTIAAYKQQPDAEKAAELDAALDGLAERFDVGESGYLVLEWEYLLLTARRA